MYEYVLQKPHMIGHDAKCRKADTPSRSAEPDVPLYVPSGALRSAAPLLGAGDAFAALTGGPALPDSSQLPRAPFGQPLEAFRRPTPAKSDDRILQSTSETDLKQTAGKKSESIFGDVSVIASAPAQQDSPMPEEHGSAEPSQVADGKSSDPARVDHQGDRDILSAEPLPLAAAAEEPLEQSHQPHAEPDPVDSAAAVPPDPSDHSASPTEAADLSRGEQDAALLDEGTAVAPEEPVHVDLLVQTDATVAPIQVSEAQAVSPAPLYDLLPVLGLGSAAAEEGADMPDPDVRHMSTDPASHDAPAAPAILQFAVPSTVNEFPAAERTEPQIPADQAEDAQPLYNALPALGSWLAAAPLAPTAGPAHAADPLSVPGAELQPEAASQTIKERGPAGEAPRLVLPGSKAGQKRARQAAAAAAGAAARHQLPTKRSWEEWLQPGAFLSLHLSHCLL